MYLEDWFDPYNIEHLKAYRHLEKEGFWPANFLPKEVFIQNSGWHFRLLAKLADAWLNQQLSKE